MPRAQRTKSAVHEALQRRAGERPGASFSVKLDAPPQPRVPPNRGSHRGVSLSPPHTRKHRIHTIRTLRAAQILLRALRDALLCPWVFC
jgi:hypothetical protein